MLKVVKKGEFNTRRGYTNAGQRIVYALFNDGAVYFRDRARLIDGWISTDCADVTDREVLAAYDANAYGLGAPTDEHHMIAYNLHMN